MPLMVLDPSKINELSTQFFEKEEKFTFLEQKGLGQFLHQRKNTDC